MNEIIFMVQEPPEGGFAAEALGYPIFTVGETLEELNEMVRDAVICHFEEENRPKIIRLHFVREEVIAV
jgi:predicted RNase H-like HicB family nuclease